MLAKSGGTEQTGKQSEPPTSPTPLSAGDVVLAGCSTLSLLTSTLQQLNHVFELYLGPWGPGQKGFVALPSHPADSPIILQLQFLFDVLQKTLSLKVLGDDKGLKQDIDRTQGGVRVGEHGRIDLEIVGGSLEVQRRGYGVWGRRTSVMWVFLL